MHLHRFAKPVHLILIVLLLAMGGLLTACGGDSATEAPPAETSAASGEQTTGTEADTAPTDPPAADTETTDADPPAEIVPATTVAQALALLDMRNMSMPADADLQGQPEVGEINYQAPLGVAEVVEFYRSLLLDQGWQEAEGGYADDSTAALFFTNNGFAVSITASDLGGSSSVTLLHHGNINPAALPQTADAETGFAAPNMLMYFSPTGVADVAEFVRTELAAQGWHQYTRPNTATADDPNSQTRSYIQNGVELTAFISTAPAQDNKTAVQYTMLLLPLDMPLQPDAANVEFDSSQPYLSYRTASAPEAVADFYREQMSDLGWEEIADLAVVTPEQTALQFINNAQEAALQLLLAQDDNQTTVTLGADLDVPVAITESDTDTDTDMEDDTGDSSEPEVEALPAGDMPAVPLPADAESVAYDPDFGEITFTSATDIAGLSEFYRREMAAIGWEEDTLFSIENDTFASIDFNQGDETIILTIFDLDGSSEIALDLNSAPSLAGGSFETDDGDSMDIEPPADAPTFTINDWPTPPTATEINLSGEILSYKVAMPLVDVAEFYRPTFEQMEIGTGCLDDAADYTSLSCSSSNGDITLNFYAFESFEDTEVEIDFINYNYPVEGGSSGDDSGELTAEDNDGLPLPSDNTGYFSEGSEFSREVVVTSPSDIPTLLEFYQTELAARGWQEDNTTTDGDTTVVDFSGPDGILTLTLAPTAGETEVVLNSKNPTAAEEAGVLPPAGQARLFLINFSPEALTVTVNDQEIEVPVEAGMDSPDTAPTVDLPPGSYTVTFSVGGQTLSDDVEVGPDESWGLLLDDEGVLPLLVY